MSEMLRDLVVSLSLDSDNFSRNLTSINRQIQEAESEFRLAATGVNGFENSVSGTRTQIGMLQQKLALQQKSVTQYERALAQANTRLEAASTRQKALTASLSQASTRNAELKEKVAAATRQYEAFKRELGENDSATIAAKNNLDALSQEYAESSGEVKKLEGQLAANTKNLQNNADAVTRAGTNLNNARTALRQTETEIDAATQRLARLQSAWAHAGDALTAFGTKCAAVSASLDKVGKSMTTYLTAPLLALGTAAVKASVDFESAFASVRKTVDATEEEYQSLSDSVKQMSTEVATSTSEIAEVMANAGQLGIHNDSLVSFTRTMIDLGNSTDVAADAAATAIAQFANVTGMAQTEFGNFGSALVDLGNNYATTESRILDMSTRLAASGSQVGLNQAQILGFATALSSVGLEAEAGGTAFSKAMIQMQVAVETGNDSLKDFANVSGMTTDAFKTLWKSDPAGAIEAFIVGLSKMDEQGVSSIVTLQEMGFTEVRLRDTLMRATNATGLFSAAQRTAGNAWKQNNALSNEAGKRYATTASRLTNLKNTALLFAQQIGDDLNPTIQKLVDGANDLLEKFMSLDEAQRLQIIKIAAVAAAAGPAILVFSKITKGVGTVSTALGKFCTSVATAGGGFKGFASVLAKSPAVWIAIAAAAAYATVAIVDYATGAKQAREALEGMAETAENWKNTAADTFYGKDGLSFFGMSEDNFNSSIRSAEDWKTGLMAVWSDGKAETGDIVSQWVESWKTLTDATRTELQNLQAAAEESGYSGVSEQLARDIEQLDAVDAEVEALLKKRQNGYFTDADQARLQELADIRGAIEIHYNLSPANEDGFGGIIEGVQAEIARAQAKGLKGADVTMYENAVLAAAEGMAAMNATLDEQYDKEHAVIQLMDDEQEKSAALAALDQKYNSDRLAGAREYAQTLAGVVMPVWEQGDIQEAGDDVDRLTQLMTKFSAAGDGERPAILEEMNSLTAGMDEAALTEYVSLLTQIQSLMDSGMSQEEVQGLFPEIDFSGALQQIAGIQDFLKDRDTLLPGLASMFGESLPEEVLKITTDLDMTGAQARWDTFAANPGSITTEALVSGYAEAPDATKYSPLLAAAISSYQESGEITAFTPLLSAMISSYQESGDITAFTPLLNAMIGSYQESGDITAFTPLLSAMISGYQESGDITAFTPLLNALIAGYQESGDITAFTPLLNAMIGGYSQSGDATPFVPLFAAMISSYGESANAALFKPIMQALLSRYTELGPAAGFSPEMVAAITAYQESGDITAFVPLLSAMISGYQESGDITAFTPLLNAMISGYQESGDITAFTPLLSAMISSYQESGEITAFTPLLSAMISGYQESGDITAFTPLLSALISGYQESGDITAFTPLLNAMIGSYQESGDITAFVPLVVAMITAYEESPDVVKPTAQVQGRIALTGYDLSAYREFVKRNPVEVQGIYRFGDLYGSSSEALLDPGTKFWQNGVEVPVEAVTEDMLTADKVAVLDSDGTVHVLVTPEITGTPDAVETANNLIESTEHQGTPIQRLAGTDTMADMDMLIMKLREVKRTMDSPILSLGGWLNGYEWQSATDAISSLLDPSEIGNIQAFVGECVAALNSGETLSDDVVAKLETIQSMVQLMESIGAGQDVTAGLAQSLDETGFESAAETVSATLEEIVTKARQVGTDAGAGVNEGMAGSDMTGGAESIASNSETALRTSFDSNSPAKRMLPIGRDVAAGVAVGMAEYGMNASSSLLASKLQLALANELNMNTFRAIGLNAMAGLRLGIITGTSSVVAAMRAAARSAVSAAKRELKIQSPSRVFRDEVGRMTMKGFGEGVLTESKEQAKIIANAARYLTGEARGGAADTMTSDNRRSYTDNSSVNLTVSSMSVRDELDIQALAREIAQLTKRNQRGLGLRMA